MVVASLVLFGWFRQTTYSYDVIVFLSYIATGRWQATHHVLAQQDEDLLNVISNWSDQEDNEGIHLVAKSIINLFHYLIIDCREEFLSRQRPKQRSKKQNQWINRASCGGGDISDLEPLASPEFSCGCVINNTTLLLGPSAPPPPLFHSVISDCRAEQPLSTFHLIVVSHPKTPSLGIDRDELSGSQCRMAGQLPNCLSVCLSVYSIYWCQREWEATFGFLLLLHLLIEFLL